jgi:hypothetical protein
MYVGVLKGFQAVGKEQDDECLVLFRLHVRTCQTRHKMNHLNRNINDKKYSKSCKLSKDVVIWLVLSLSLHVKKCAVDVLSRLVALLSLSLSRSISLSLARSRARTLALSRARSLARSIARSLARSLAPAVCLTRARARALALALALPIPLSLSLPPNFSLPLLLTRARARSLSFSVSRSLARSRTRTHFRASPSPCSFVSLAVS